MSNPSQFWINLLPKKGDKQNPASRRYDYCRKVLDLLEAKHPDLYLGHTGATLSLEEAQALVDTLQKNSAGHIFKHRISYLIRGLEKGALELGWNVAIPQSPLVIPRDKPRFTLDSFTALPSVYAVEAAFLENLKQPSLETHTTRVGQLLLSAILFGGLVQKRWLAPWVETLTSATCGASQLWLNMVLTPVHLERARHATGKAGKTKPTHSNSREKWEIHKRWFADPLTHALILRWYKDFPGDLKAGRDVSPLLAIRQYLDLILKNPRKTSESFVLELLRGSATRTGLGVPSFLLAYAEGANKSVSLSSEAWDRLVTGKCITSTRKNFNNDDDVVIPVSDPLNIPTAQHIAPMVHQEKMLKEVLGIILPSGTSCKRKASDAKEALQAFYEKNQATMCQALSGLVLWCVDLLTHYLLTELIRGRVKCGLRASSVRRYLNTIGKRLIAVAGNTDIFDLESDELHDLYREVIDLCATKKAKNTAGTRLHGFHFFLSIKLGAPSVDFSDLGVKSGPAETGVNANLISFNSFDQMKIALCPVYSTATRMRKMQLLLAIIAFRCGLRRNEALKLRLIDFLGEVEPELLVRSNRYGYLKSSESIRRIPLASLLEEDELKYLLAWRWDRSSEDNSSNPESLLFCLEGQPTVLLPEHIIFPPIMQAIHQVTGDRNLVFHHFRHSFATWMLIRLLNDFSTEMRQRFNFLDHYLFDPQNCNRLRKAILGNQRLGRQALFATAQLCGHAGPEVTLLHYVHLCDWLLGLGVSALDNQPKLDFATIKAITDLPQHILYYDKDKHIDATWQMSLVLERMAIPDELKPKSTLLKVDTRHIPENDTECIDSKRLFWRRIYAVIHEHQIGRQPIEVLAARSGFAVDDIKTWNTNTERLAAMKTKRGNPRHVNGITCRTNPAFQFPHPLRLKEDRKVADIVLASFEACRGRKRQGLIQGVRHFITSYSVGEGGFPCQNPQEVNKHIRFLTSLNIPIQQILVMRIRPRTTKLSTEEEQTKLARRFGLSDGSVVVRNLYVHEYSKTGAYIVQIINAQVDKSNKLKANYGFRFAIYMIAIMEGLE